MTERNRNLGEVLRAAGQGLAERPEPKLPQRKARMAMVHRALVDNHGHIVRMVAEMYQFGLGWDFVYRQATPPGYKDLGLISYLGYEYYCSMYYEGFADDEGPKEAPTPGDIRRF